LGALTTKRRSALEEAEKIMMSVDELHLEFAKRAAPFNNWMDGAREDLADMFIVHQLEEIQGLIEAHNQFKNTLGAADAEFVSVEGLVQQVQTVATKYGLGREAIENPYTNLTITSISNKWTEVKQLVPQRDQVLQAELVKQQNNERLRQAFAAKANTVGPWIERQSDAIASIPLQMQGTLEQQLQRLKQYQTAVVSYKPNMDELEKHNQEIQEAVIFDNRYTPYTMETLRVGWEQLLTAIARNINEVENQMLTRDSKGLTEEQLNEYRASFNHFDKSHRRSLDAIEVRNCLISVGSNIQDTTQSCGSMEGLVQTFCTDQGMGDADFQRILSIVDPNNTGRVTFDAFLDFMTRETQDNDTAEQVLQSFRILAGEKPFITADILRRELPPDQSEYCISRMLPYQGADAVPGALDYMTFATSLYGESDL
jgi:actinin alpha